MDAAIRETEEEAGIKIADINVHHNFEKILRVIKTITCIISVIFQCFGFKNRNLPNNF